MPYAPGGPRPGPGEKPNVKLVRLAIDYENPAREWWESGGQELWEAVAESGDAGSTIVESAIADSWLAQAADLPGWEGGPEYAPHPICLKDVDPDEDVRA